MSVIQCNNFGEIELIYVSEISCKDSLCKIIEGSHNDFSIFYSVNKTSQINLGSVPINLYIYKVTHYLKCVP